MFAGIDVVEIGWCGLRILLLDCAILVNCPEILHRKLYLIWRFFSASYCGQEQVTHPHFVNDSLPDFSTPWLDLLAVKLLLLLADRWDPRFYINAPLPSAFPTIAIVAQNRFLVVTYFFLLSIVHYNVFVVFSRALLDLLLATWIIQKLPTHRSLILENRRKPSCLHRWRTSR